MTERGLKYLCDIERAIEMIEDFTRAVETFDDYAHDLKTQSAVERQLGIIGESVNKFDILFPDNSLANAKSIIGFRNRLIHAYDAVDISMIWAILKKHLTPLKEEVKSRIIKHK